MRTLLIGILEGRGAPVAESAMMGVGVGEGADVGVETAFRADDVIRSRMKCRRCESFLLSEEGTGLFEWWMRRSMMQSDAEEEREARPEEREDATDMVLLLDIVGFFSASFARLSRSLFLADSVFMMGDEDAEAVED